MEVSESNAILGNTVDVGRADLAAKTADIRETQVVSDDDEEVGTGHGEYTWIHLEEQTEGLCLYTEYV